MIPEFWRERWQEGRIGFNQSDINPLLIQYFSHLKLPVGSRVFVPLSGKSIDMVWLAAQGYEVVGIELVESAVHAFFAEQHITPTITDHDDMRCYQGVLEGETITLWVGDIFVLTADDIGHIDAVYDRAALIAMPPDMRPKYSEQVRTLSGGAPQLLLTLNYDQNEWAGPPFAVSSEHVAQYYGSHYQLTKLSDAPATLNAAPTMAVTEQVWVLERV